MVISSSEDCCPAGGADGVGAETVVKPYAAISDTIQAWSLVDSTSVAAHRMRCVIVRHDEKDIWGCTCHCWVFSVSFELGRSVLQEINQDWIDDLGLFVVG